MSSHEKVKVVKVHCSASDAHATLMLKYFNQIKLISDELTPPVIVDRVAVADQSLTKIISKAISE